MQQLTRTYSTMTEPLLALGDWLQAEGVTHLAMESTGVYWKPIWNLLEERFEILLVNAQHIKHVPGRKTDVKDSASIAQLLQCGLLRGSFVPPPPQRELRELTRQSHSPKTVRGELGELTLDTPRDRKGTLEPQFIAKHQRRLTGFDEKILARYTKGRTTRDIHDVIKELYGVDVSPTLVSEITADLDAEVTSWRQRRLAAKQHKLSSKPRSQTC